MHRLSVTVTTMAVGTALSSRDTFPVLMYPIMNPPTAGYVIVCIVVCLLLLFVVVQDEDGDSVYSEARYQLPVPSFMGEVTVVSTT